MLNSITADNPLPSHISDKCPSKPNPVTSVIAFTASIRPNSSPSLLSVTMLFNAIAASSSSRIPRFCAVDKIPTPNGLVRYKRQPAVAVEFCLSDVISTMPLTASPKTGSGQSMLWPPASVIPASAHTAREPSSTFWATSAGSLLIGHPRIAIANTGLPPIAYTSLIAFADAMRPKS